QVFRTSHAPVLEGEVLQVQEHSLDGGQDWVTWNPVGAFHGSGPGDRDYVLDHVTGEVFFGDGAHGAIPPAGRANVRMKRYGTGGGSRGNRKAGTIVEMKTTTPYVERATNLEDSVGGTDAD